MKNEALSQKIYNGAIKNARNHPIDYEYLSKFHNDILEVEFIDLVIETLNNFPAIYSEYFLKCSSKHWNNFKTEDWTNLIPNVISLQGLYSLIEFSNKILGVKLLDNLESTSCFSKKVVQETVDYYKSNPWLLLNDEDDLEEYESGQLGFDFKESIEEYRSKIGNNIFSSEKDVLSFLEKV